MSRSAPRARLPCGFIPSLPCSLPFITAIGKVGLQRRAPQDGARGSIPPGDPVALAHPNEVPVLHLEILRQSQEAQDLIDLRGRGLAEILVAKRQRGGVDGGTDGGRG